MKTITLGCRLNFAESEAIRRLAPDRPDLVVVNSCAVTAEAMRQSRQAIRRARRQRPEAQIVVTGCAAQLDPDRFTAMPEVDRVVGNGAKLQAAAYMLPPVPHPAGEPVPSSPDAMGGRGSRPALLPALAAAPLAVAAGYRQRVRSFVAVQVGCDHRCTFCTIWQARGPSRSLPLVAIRDAIARELDSGAREIVLTGVDVTSYAGGLGRLVERLLAALPALPRLRLSSLDSVEIDEALLALIAGEPRLMPHFHLSLQSGDDLILKRMKRRHSRAQAVALVERIKAARPGATIGADLIAGFPTESEEMAANSLRLLDDCDIVAAHVFPFSPRPGTAAGRMPQVERERVRARAASLRQAAAERRARWLRSLIGTVQPVLVENHGRGHSDSFAPVAIAGSLRGDHGLARMTAVGDGELVGQWT